MFFVIFSIIHKMDEKSKNISSQVHQLNKILDQKPSHDIIGAIQVKIVKAYRIKNNFTSIVCDTSVTLHVRMDDPQMQRRNIPVVLTC